MNWINTKQPVPLSNENFRKIINGFVFECPTSIRKTKNKKTTYQRVSVRGKSFRDKNINKDLLKTLAAQIKRYLKNGFYRKVKTSNEITMNEMPTHFKDKKFEFIIFRNREDMSDIETIFYCIRNALAHGSFEVISSENHKIYEFESSKDGDIKSRMRLKEETLLKILDLASLKSKEIKGLKKK